MNPSPEKDPYELQDVIERVSDALIEAQPETAIIAIAVEFDVDLADLGDRVSD
jgi:hypothetical protein